LFNKEEAVRSERPWRRAANRLFLFLS